ncbi:tyrosine-type recombinase/integrase [Deinococcus soli (ex Cha et al. 2016)]|uniref:Integrase/recombinase XerC n=2 Tax=Deinococcus soli (ex Cha et al. 2016) TaxID=1309411 RepID=A0AAE3XD12_9DEIO|nr:tyrosine-type recombinase/integrase [Deinococcus soli (ex Cha et al. 2016)]MDR6218252.1 integrase/recombinase XerC [Deinococcus soli (ex Cha et al. 2016)]MDR6328992.1 integrase/recombinase XerC [Deinococcus soli (ex Cha et al. 2016)]MDR6751265.1 integrase/recombinase XerC [Deinococcus soli (ex Cha et al. 2016)]
MSHDPDEDSMMDNVTIHTGNPGLNIDPTYSKSTQQQYNLALKQYFKYLLESGVPFHDADADVASDYVEYLLGKGFKARTIASRLAPVRAVYDQAHARGLIASNPFTSVKITINRDEGGAPPYTQADIDQLLAHATAWERATVLLAAHAALRISESADLRWEHINWITQELTVPGELEGHTHYVRMSNALRDALWQIRKGSDPQAPLEGKVLDVSGPHTVRRALKLLAERAGVTWKTHSSFRRYAATRLLEETGDLTYVREHLRLQSLRDAAHAASQPRKVTPDVKNW